MNNFIFKKIFNSPIKKCVITKDFYPMCLMIRLVKAKNSEGEETFIPDSMYSKVFSKLK